MKISRNWLQTYFDTPLPSAQELADLFTFYTFEVEEVVQKGDDWIIDIDVLSNRSSDCFSYRGVAREVATLLELPLKQDPLRETLPAWERPANLSVTVEDSTLTPRYMAAVVRGVEVRESPEWLKQALSSIGQKSINNVVDATNYVMLNLGQPIHAFDLSKLTIDKNGEYNITVRLAKEEGEQIVTLTGDEYTLKHTHQIITDGISNAPLALAGIKGGKQAEVTKDTTDIVIEVANFNAVNVRRTSNDLKLHTDASLRFQNEVPARLAAFAMRDVLKLIADIANGKEAGVFDVYKEEAENQPIDVTKTDITKLLGVELSIEDIEKILMRLEWEFSLDGEEFAVTGPWERTDIAIKEAIIEEIGRIYGYKNIKATLPGVPKEEPVVNTHQYYTERVERMFSELGYSEVLTYTIVDAGVVELANPFASDKSFMRMNLRNGVARALDLNAQNAPLLGLDTVKVFEIGTIFTEHGERLSFCVGVRAVTGKQGKAEVALKEDVLKFLEVFGVKIEPKIVDGIFEIELHNIIPLLPVPKSYETPLSWDTDVRYERWSSYPFVLRDIAVWVPKIVSSDEVLTLVKESGTNLLVRHDQFDVFEKGDKVSYAWHLVFQSTERTLTDEEVGNIMQSVTKKLQQNEGWEVR